MKQAKVELTFKDEQIEDLVRQNEELDRKTEELRQQIELLQRRLYGPRSERYHPDQLFLDNLLKEAQSQALDPLEPSIPVTATLRRKARPHGRMKIPDHIERVDELLDLPDEQKKDPDTGQALVKLRDEISEKLAWKPGSWYVRRFIRPVYVHPDRQSEKAGVYVRTMPDSPVEKCKADTSVLALVAVKKYVDHLPLYRQREIFQREGIDVAPSTLNAWAIEPILACEPLYNALKVDVLSRPAIFTDDTEVRMLENGLGRTKRARMWVYVGGCGPPHRYFDFTEDRRKERPLHILADYTGFVHADAYSGYDELFNSHEYIIEVGCWAHTRRKFDEALNSAVKPCTEILLRIRALYKIEASIRGAEPLERLKVRQRESIPLLDKLYQRFEQMCVAREVLPSSAFGKAIGYAINQRQALHRYTTDGRLEIDNNIAENAIRPLALGRKNWLFAGSPRGGKACAIALSLLQSAKVVGINPYDYLHDIYNRIMSHPVSRLHELLPAAWKRSRDGP
ncbi:MAG: IS66 family transposase [Planctomycetes bacterium]|nr:IS66 family transposase [Planctomycetota bacterium]